MKERDIKRAIRVALGADPRLVLFNRPVGHLVLTVRCPECNALVDVRKHAEPGARVPFGEVGEGDLGGVTFEGRALSWETKTETGRLSKDQERFGRMFRAVGGHYAVLRSVEDGKRALEDALGWAPPRPDWFRSLK